MAWFSRLALGFSRSRPSRPNRLNPLGPGGSDSVPDALLGHVDDRLALRQVRAVDEAADALAALRLAQVDAEGAGVADDVAADGARRVAEEGVRLGGHLVRDDAGGVLDAGQALQVVHVLVELALAVGQRAAADELGAEVRRQGGDGDEAGGGLAAGTRCA